jgi:acetyl-CoA synthetase
VAGILDVRRYPEAAQGFRWRALWDLFDGDATRLNLAHECVDRWVGRPTALRLKHADGRTEERSFQELADWSSRFANLLESEGVAAGDRVAVMLEPSLAFYGAVFGAVKRGAVAVPLFTLLGPDGVRLRVDDCQPRLLLVARDAERWQQVFERVSVVAVDDAFHLRLAAASPRYVPATRADDLAVLQYTSGTTRGLPEAVRHTHRAVVTLMVAAHYGLGLQPGDHYFCPSSPAWGHGLWHGTIAPLALGIAVGAYAGKFHAARLLEALDEFRVTNLAAAPTVFRMLRGSGLAEGRRLALERITFTGEPMDSRTWEWIEKTFGVAPCGMYGSTEVGVIIVNYPGFAGYVVKPGALGRPAPGWEVAIVDARGEPLPPGTVGEIAVRRKGGWFRVKDRGWMDPEGYVHHEGRSDDVIISAGWTMSAVEIEDALLSHPDVREAAVVAAPDPLRGQIPKAYVVSARVDPAFARELQEWVGARLSAHEYPRAVELVEELPKTPAGKTDRRALRERAGARA